MNLREYIQTKKISRVDMASALGTTPGYLTHIINGRRPGLKLCRKLIEVSKGQITLADLRPDIATLRG